MGTKKPSYKKSSSWAKGSYKQDNDRILKELRVFNTGWEKIRTHLKKNK